MPPHLTPSDGGHVVVTSIFPPEFSAYRVAGASCTHYAWSSGQALIQLLEGEPGIRQITLQFNEEGGVHFTDRVPAVFLQFLDPEGDCNVVSRAAGGEVFTGKPGVVYSRLELYFPDTTMRLMAGHFRGLGGLLARAAGGGAGKLGETDRPITGAIAESLKELFRVGFGVELSAMYRKERGMELLFAVLELFN